MRINTVSCGPWMDRLTSSFLRKCLPDPESESSELSVCLLSASKVSTEKEAAGFGTSLATAHMVFFKTVSIFHCMHTSHFDKDNLKKTHPQGLGLIVLVLYQRPSQVTLPCVHCKCRREPRGCPSVLESGPWLTLLARSVPTTAFAQSCSRINHEIQDSYATLGTSLHCFCWFRRLDTGDFFWCLVGAGSRHICRKRKKLSGSLKAHRFTL